MKLGEKIMYARKKAGMSQIDLADILGVSRQSISKWETNESNPDISKLTTIAKTLNVSTDWLLSEEDITQDEIRTEEEDNAFADQKQYPEWVDRLPKFAVGMVKKYGWLYGARTAVGGLFFTLFGIFTRIMSHNFIFGSSNSFDPFTGGFEYSYDPFAEVHQKAWSGFSAITGFAIAIGIVTTIFGVVLAVSLKNWGSKNE